LNHALGDTINPQRPIAAHANNCFTSAFGGIADVAGPTAGLVPVENDPTTTQAVRCRVVFMLISAAIVVLLSLGDDVKRRNLFDGDKKDGN